MFDRVMEHFKRSKRTLSDEKNLVQHLQSVSTCIKRSSAFKGSLLNFIKRAISYLDSLETTKYEVGNSIDRTQQYLYTYRHQSRT